MQDDRLLRRNEELGLKMQICPPLTNPTLKPRNDILKPRNGSKGNHAMTKPRVLTLTILT